MTSTKSTMQDGDGQTLRFISVDYFRLTPLTIRDEHDRWRIKPDGTFYSVTTSQEGQCLTEAEWRESVASNGWAQQYVHFHIRNFLVCVPCCGRGKIAKRTRRSYTDHICKHCSGEGERQLNEFDVWDLTRLDGLAAPMAEIA